MVPRTHYTGWRPISAYPAPCGLGPCCEFQEHADLELIPHLSCFTGTGHASVCPPEARQPRPASTFDVSVHERDGHVEVWLMDDDDHDLHWVRPTTPGLYEATARWLNGLAYLDIPAIQARFRAWERV